MTAPASPQPVTRERLGLGSFALVLAGLAADAWRVAMTRAVLATTLGADPSVPFGSTRRGSAAISRFW